LQPGRAGSKQADFSGMNDGKENLYNSATED
jgi:hypothetical protein